MSNVNKCKAQSKERVEREPMDQAQTQGYVIEVRAPSSTSPPSTHEGFPLARPPRTLTRSTHSTGVQPQPPLEAKAPSQQ